MTDARTAAHTCHAEGCDKRVPPRLLMCARHWRMVPYGLKLAVYAEYQPGQEKLDGTAFPTDDYLDAAHEAIEAVAEKEGLRG
jgi:hypothetical protein